MKAPSFNLFLILSRFDLSLSFTEFKFETVEEIDSDEYGIDSLIPLAVV